MVKHFVILFVLVFLSRSTYAQRDTANLLPEFTHIDSLRKTFDANSTQQDQIDKMPVYQVDEVLQKIPGVSIKNYGGYGGLKTFSMQGLGAQHSGVIVNDIPQTMSNGGVVNLSTIPVEYLEKASLNVVNSFEYLLPAISYRSANTLYLKDQLQYWKNEKITANLKLDYGSFDHYGVSGMAVFQTKKKYQIGAFGKFVSNKGDFPFQYQTGDVTTSDFRKNAQFQEWQAQVTQLIKLSNNQQLNITLQGYQTQQNLPGAIVLYQSGLSGQSLDKTQLNLKLDYQWTKSDWNGKIIVNGQLENTNYQDTNFLNSEGVLHQEYQQKSILFSSPFAKYWNRWKLFGAVDFRWQSLDGINYSESVIERIEVPLVLGFKWQNQGFFANANTLVQWIKNGEENIFSANPYVEFGKNWNNISLKTFYKNALRLPTFYEQYYGKYVETIVKPEKANQLALDFMIHGNVLKKKMYLQFNAKAFYNLIKDKIVSQPTKDLFIWSIENYGVVHTYGVTASGHVNYKINTHHKVVINANYTLQYALDKTDATSILYNQQIPYTPYNLINAGIDYEWKNLFFSFQYHYNGFRFAWKENSWTNVLEDFHLLDIAVGYNLKLRKDHKLTFKISGKNLFDSQYEVIRSYPMPGAHALISVRYAFH